MGGEDPINPVGPKPTDPDRCRPSLWATCQWVKTPHVCLLLFCYFSLEFFSRQFQARPIVVEITSRWYIWGVLQCVAVCCSVLQCVAVCCSVLQCVAVCFNIWRNFKFSLCYCVYVYTYKSRSRWSRRAVCMHTYINVYLYLYILIYKHKWIYIYA